MRKQKESSRFGASPPPETRPAHAFFHPEPERAGRDVFPVFLPFAGCPQRCVYCAQDVQTDRQPASTETLLAAAAKDLWAAPDTVEELAFYGGTFTALPEADLERCLAFARSLRDVGRIRRFRCSTRPDAVNPAVLERMRRSGCSLVELGVQSFSDAALAAAGRGYSGATAERACRMVLDAGLALGIQLMPGLPGLSLEAAVEDAARAAALRPACARLYPCVVFAGSPLARLWESGSYASLGEPEAVEILARSCLVLWKAGVRVIRMGLAEPERLRERALAGPLHSSLGNLARIRALYLLVEQEARRFRSSGFSGRLLLRVPRSRQGEAFAPANFPLAPYADIGIDRVEVHDEPDFLLMPLEGRSALP